MDFNKETGGTKENSDLVPTDLAPGETEDKVAVEGEEVVVEEEESLCQKTTLMQI